MPTVLQVEQYLAHTPGGTLINPQKEKAFFRGIISKDAEGNILFSPVTDEPEFIIFPSITHEGIESIDIFSRIMVKGTEYDFGEIKFKLSFDDIVTLAFEEGDDALHTLGWLGALKAIFRGDKCGACREIISALIIMAIQYVIGQPDWYKKVIEYFKTIKIFAPLAEKIAGALLGFGLEELLKQSGAYRTLLNQVCKIIRLC